jgi:hypothetical protein
MVLGLSAGALLAEAAVLVPFWRSLPPDAFLAWYAEHAALLFGFFAPLEIASVILSLAAAGLSRFRRRTLVVSAALALAVLIPFPLYFQHVNAVFAAGSIGVDQVGEELARWARWHWARTGLAMSAFSAAALGLRR